MGKKYQVIVEVLTCETVMVEAKDENSAIEKARLKIWKKFFLGNIQRCLISEIPD